MTFKYFLWANKRIAINQLLSIMVCCLSVAALAAADAPGPGLVYPPQRKKVVVAPEQAQPKPPPAVEPAPLVMEPDCDWGFRLAAGVPVWFFEDEGNLPGAGAYADFFNNGRQVNLRVGVEGRHMYLGQEAAALEGETSQKTARVTFLRIPFSVEYIAPIEGDTTQLFLGGGPDIVHTANDIESTEVGAHLSARLLHNFYENWGVAVEGGYMWAKADLPGKDANLGGAYITPTLNYTF